MDRHQQQRQSIAAQGGAENPGKLGVSVRNEVCVLLSAGRRPRVSKLRTVPRRAYAGVRGRVLPPSCVRQRSLRQTIAAAILAQAGDDLSQEEEAPIDVPSVLRRLVLVILAACKVYDVQLRAPGSLPCRACTLEAKAEDGMGAATVVVPSGPCITPALLTPCNEPQHVLGTANRRFPQALHIEAPACILLDWKRRRGLARAVCQ
mmetsp:Transcript_88611/g.211576  ORF Transcript_88611/g.211576 Transcript_88611/m.211576 type:complete len:205 (+) Transcript_88611:771-1385(+)